MTKTSVSLAVALSTFANVKADPSLTKGRNIIDVSNRVAVKTVAIGKFLTAIRALKAVQVQRNDLYRLTNGLAKHLAEFQLPQTVFHLVRFNGTWYLADGNTRKRFWLSSNSCDLPSHVNLVVYDADTMEEVQAVYDCLDSQKSKKTNRDTLLSYLHVAGLDPQSLSSKLVAGGKLVSVVRNMTRAEFAGTASPHRKAMVIKAHLQSFRELDKFGWDEKVVPAGAVWALMRLYKEVPREFLHFVDMYALDIAKMNTNLEILVPESVRISYVKAYEDCKTYGVGTSGERPQPVMFKRFLRGFGMYIRELDRSGRVPARLSAYKKVLEKFISAEVARIEQLLPAIA